MKFGRQELPIVVVIFVRLGCRSVVVGGGFSDDMFGARPARLIRVRSPTIVTGQVVIDRESWLLSAFNHIPMLVMITALSPHFASYAFRSARPRSITHAADGIVLAEVALNRTPRNCRSESRSAANIRVCNSTKWGERGARGWATTAAWASPRRLPNRGCRRRQCIADRLRGSARRRQRERLTLERSASVGPSTRRQRLTLCSRPERERERAMPSDRCGRSTPSIS